MNRVEHADFVLAWLDAASQTEVARLLNMPLGSVSSRACRLRVIGVWLPPFPRGGHRPPAAQVRRRISNDDAIAAWRSSSSLTEVAKRLNTSMSDAVRIRHRLRRVGIYLPEFPRGGFKPRATHFNPRVDVDALNRIVQMRMPSFTVYSVDATWRSSAKALHAARGEADFHAACNHSIPLNENEGFDSTTMQRRVCQRCAVIVRMKAKGERT